MVIFWFNLAFTISCLIIWLSSRVRHTTNKQTNNWYLFWRKTRFLKKQGSYFGTYCNTNHKFVHQFWSKIKLNVYAWFPVILFLAVSKHRASYASNHPSINPAVLQASIFTKPKCALWKLFFKCGPTPLEGHLAQPLLGLYFSFH